MISESAILLYAAKKEGIIKSNAHFWREYSSAEKLKNFSLDLEKYARVIQNSGVNLICALDRDFPPLPVYCKPSEKPYLFAYRGDISLLKGRAKNFAVVGSLTPTDKILHRENATVAELTELGYHIVSGLAKGCDTAAHMTCLACGGKTIAMLPSTLSHIYPKENARLAERIVQSGGLVLTEYVTEPATRYDRIRRTRQIAGDVCRENSFDRKPPSGARGQRFTSRNGKSKRVRHRAFYLIRSDDRRS